VFRKRQTRLHTIALLRSAPSLDGAKPRTHSSRHDIAKNRMSEIIFVVEEAPEGGYTARALGASIFTEADTVDDLRTAIRHAVQCHFDGAEAQPQNDRMR
jgi:hypothetical protein